MPIPKEKNFPDDRRVENIFLRSLPEIVELLIHTAKDPAVFAVKAIRTAVGFEDRFHADLSINFKWSDCSGKIHGIGTA